MNAQQQDLLTAVTHGNNRDLQALLAQGVALNFEDAAGTTPLCLAARCRYDIVRRLCEHGADVNYVGSDRISALHWAVEYDNDEIMGYLISQGIDLHHRDKLVETPLHWACWTSHLKAARILIAAGADPHLRNIGAKKPLELAVMQQHHELIAYLQPLCA